jgi:hypothetical protein
MRIPSSLTITVIILLSFSIAPAAEKNTSGISIQQGVICLDIVDRNPIGTGDIFTKEISKLFCFTKIVGAQNPTTVTHIWYLNGLLQSKVVLPVNSASWRTWSSVKMSPEKTGEWMVEVVSEDGVALESIIFLVK